MFTPLRWLSPVHWKERSEERSTETSRDVLNVTTTGGNAQLVPRITYTLLEALGYDCLII